MTKAENPASRPIDHLARCGAPDAAALLIGDKVTTFAELDAGIGRLASWLLEQAGAVVRSEEHTSELQSLMHISYAVFCLKKKKNNTTQQHEDIDTKHKKQATKKRRNVSKHKTSIQTEGT